VISNKDGGFLNWHILLFVIIFQFLVFVHNKRLWLSNKT